MVRQLGYCKEIVAQLPLHSDFLSQIRKKECIFIFKEKVVRFYFLTSEVITCNCDWHHIDFSLMVQNQCQVINPIEEKEDIIEEDLSPRKCPEDLIGTPLECPFNLDVLKIKDDEFYSKEVCESHHLSELKVCKYRPYSSFEARYRCLGCLELYSN